MKKGASQHIQELGLAGTEIYVQRLPHRVAIHARKTKLRDAWVGRLIHHVQPHGLEPNHVEHAKGWVTKIVETAISYGEVSLDLVRAAF
jgi:hypothetical protein